MPYLGSLSKMDTLYPVPVVNRKAVFPDLYPPTAGQTPEAEQAYRNLIQDYKTRGDAIAEDLQPKTGLNLIGGQGSMIPTSAYPSSSSTSENVRASGIDWSDPYLKEVLPILTETTKGLPALVESLPGRAQNIYSNVMRSALDEQGVQGVLNQLASRNMLNSSVAADALAQTESDIASKIGAAAYPAIIESLKAQMELPSTLASLASAVGQKSIGIGGSSSSSSNPLAPYALMVDFLTRA